MAFPSQDPSANFIEYIFDAFIFLISYYFATWKVLFYFPNSLDKFVRQKIHALKEFCAETRVNALVSNATHAKLERQV